MQAPEIRHELHYGSRVLPCFAHRPGSVHAMFAEAVGRAPEAPALIEGDVQTSYAALEHEAGIVAGNLAARGVAAGDRVALLLNNRREFILAVLACARLGAIAVPMNTRQRLPETAYMLGQCGAVALIHEAGSAAQLPEPAAVPALRLRIAVGGDAAQALPWDVLVQPVAAPAPVAANEEAPFCILYTSGTTGRPKGAVLTNLGVVHSCLNYEWAMQLRAGDRAALAVPASHVTGLVAIILTMFRVGGAIVLMGEFKARIFLEQAARHGVSFGVLVPAMYKLCLLDPAFDSFDLGAWRVGGFGGAPMPEATVSELAQKLPLLRLANVYGATETTSPVTAMPPGVDMATLRDTVGHTLPCADIRIMDEDGREVPHGTSGEIWIAGPMVIPGYWNWPEADAAAFAGGYWKSGDIGSQDEAGFLRVLDRKKDMINRGGFKIYSVEVENALSHHPAVAESAVVGKPDPVLGERVVAHVVLREGADATAAEIAAYCAARLSDYKVPEIIVLREEPLPRNQNGKLLKAALRQA